jgi:hypothetical protein
MSRVEEIEKKISELDHSELRALREWFDQYDAELWDQRIGSDAKSGKLSRLAERALRDHEAGRSTEL